MKNFTRLLVAIIYFLLGNLQHSHAQVPGEALFNVPQGERLIVSFPHILSNGSEETVTITKKGVYVNGKRIYTANSQTDIISVEGKLFDNNSLLITFKSSGIRNGLSAKLTFNSLTSTWDVDLFNVLPNDYVTKTIGDDLYAMAYNAVYVSDSGFNWVIDTTGLALNGAYINDIDIDNNQKVWLATQSALYTQELNVMTWVENTNYPSSSANVVYVDREQNVWVTDYNRLRFTADDGLSFQNAPSGLPNDYIRDVSDDAFGNIYVMYDSTLYYSQDGLQPFVKISQGIPDDMDMFSSQYLFNAVSGDTLIYLATEAGLYTSNDQGGTWTYQANAVRSEHANSITATDDNRLLMTTNVGAFRLEANQTWSKRYPLNGFIPDTKMYTADNGDIYLLAENAGVNSGNNFVRMVYKSTDDGTTFAPDTAGLGAADVAMSEFFTDENGVQHASGSVYVSGSGNFVKIWKKMPGQPWELDIAGLPAEMGSSYSTQCFGSANNSKVYVVISNFGIGSTTIYSRPIAGGTWTSETSVFGFVLDVKGRNGIVTAGTEYGLIYNSGSGWKSATNPTTITAPVSWSLSEVDNKGVTWGYFEIIANNASLGQGIYYTTDFVNWSQPEDNLDSIFFSELTAIGDSVFALSRGNDGVYVFDTTSLVPVSVAAIESVDNIRIIPNPFQNTATLQFGLNSDSRVTLNIYNLLGQTVFSIPVQQMRAGAQQLKINLSNTNNGILLYEVRVNDTVFKGKLLKQ